jgi:hypothetical protein
MSGNRDWDPVRLGWVGSLAQVVEMAGFVGIVALGFLYRSLAVGGAYIVGGVFLTFRHPLWMSLQRRDFDWLVGFDFGGMLQLTGALLLALGLVILVVAVRGPWTRETSATYLSAAPVKGPP